jgi:hypothetical protein
MCNFNKMEIILIHSKCLFAMTNQSNFTKYISNIIVETGVAHHSPGSGTGSGSLFGLCSLPPQFSLGGICSGKCLPDKWSRVGDVHGCLVLGEVNTVE